MPRKQPTKSPNKQPSRAIMQRARQAKEASARPKQPVEAKSQPSATNSSAGKPVYIPFCTSATEKSVQVLSAAIAEQLGKGVTQINLLVASNGGYSVAAFHLYQFLRALPVPVITHATSETSGFGMLVFMAGQERLAVRSARFLINSNKNNTVEDGKGAPRDASEAPIQVDPYFAEIMQRDTSLETTELEDISYRQAWKSAGWAKRCGIVTRIAELKILKGAVVVQPSYL